MKKVIVILFVGLMLSGCGGVYTEVEEWHDYKNSTAKYKVYGTNKYKSYYWYTHSENSLDQALEWFHGLWMCTERYGCRVLNINGEPTTEERQAEIINKYLPPDMAQGMLEKTVSQEEKEEIQMSEMIDKAKNTCIDLGFEKGTEKFTDCSLKLYSQSVELAAKQNQQVVIQGQSSGSNVMTIYDPVRDNNALIKRGQGLINGTCTLGDLSTC